MDNTVEMRLVRSQVREELTWDLSDLFSSEQAWDEELAMIELEIAQFDRFKGILHSDAKVLLNCLCTQEQLLMRMIKADSYANLKLSADGSDSVNQANSAKFLALRTKFMAVLSFIDTEIINFEDELIERFFQEEPELVAFRKSIVELLETKEHKLSLETEKALASLGELQESPYQIYQMAKLADMNFASIQDEDGKELPVSFALFENHYEFSADTKVRRKAYRSFVSTLKQYRNTMASAYSAEVNKQIALSRIRNYQSVTEMLLEQQHVTLDMYNNQIDIIYKELAPHMRRFAILKQKVLGLDQMLFCDLKAPLDHEFNPKTTYEEARQIILESLKVMGPEYCEIIERGFRERWVDLADNIGKSTGAFCSTPYGSHPYILITWQDNMRCCFTLAHEFGHAGHFFLANKNQRVMNVEPSTYFIEAPSTMNEMLLGQHLLAVTTDKQMRRWVILQLLGTYYHNFVTHLLEAEYQRRVYTLAEEGKALTAEALTEVTSAVLTEFWGDTVVIDDGASLTWMRQPHYYMGLYPYTYSAGLTASTAVAQMIQEEGKPAVDKWLDVLRAGGSLKPLELLKRAGVDMTTPEPIRKAIAYVGTLIDELEESYE